MIRVYALTNMWPLVDATDQRPDKPAAEGDDQPDMLEALEGVYDIEGLYAAIGRSLTKAEREELKRDHELEIDDGTREIRQFEINPDAQVKSWVDKAFKTGVQTERERVWNLLCYFREKLLESNMPAEQVGILSELREMLLDCTVAPDRYHMKGVRIGKKIAVAEGAEPPTNRAADIPSPAATDPCIECGSTLDDEGHCHFVDCSKAVAPLVDCDDKPVEAKVATLATTPATTTALVPVKTADKNWICYYCGQPFGPNPDKSATSKWPETVCLSEGCRGHLRHTARFAGDPARRCGTCSWFAVWTNSWWRCPNKACAMYSIGFRSADDKDKTVAEQNAPKAPDICPLCFRSKMVINSLTKPGYFRCCACTREWPAGEVAVPTDGDCCQVLPEAQQPIQLKINPDDGKVPIGEAIRQVLAEVHNADTTGDISDK